MVIDSLLNKAEDLKIANNNWSTIIVSNKEVNGEPTDQLCLTLCVEKKLPLGEISSPGDIFPDSVIVDGENYSTDVVEMAELSANSCYTLPNPANPESTWLMPVSGNRVEHRPLVGGISVGTIPPQGWGGGSVDTGTLGGLAVDLNDNTLVGVSNNHVLSKNTLAGDLGGAYTNSSGLTWWTFLSANDTTTSVGHDRYPVFQRSTYDEYTASQATMNNLKIGTVKNAYPFKSSDNKIDVCTFALDTSVLNLTSTSVNWQQYLLDYNTPMDWATNTEIQSLLTTELGAPVFRSGRTEGPVGYPGSEPYGTTCKLSAYAIGSTNVNYGGNLGSIGFTDQIFFRSNQGSALSPSSGGDSGSFVCALFNEGTALSAWKIIGLNFAGNGTIGVMNKISNVSNMFKLSAYKGDPIDIGYKNYDMQIIESRQSALTAMIGGKMYWQAGSTGFPATTSFDT
jgi:hypothetical protein